MSNSKVSMVGKNYLYGCIPGIGKRALSTSPVTCKYHLSIEKQPPKKSVKDYLFFSGKKVKYRRNIYFLNFVQELA
jgi:hypothetical protein